MNKNYQLLIANDGMILQKIPIEKNVCIYGNLVCYFHYAFGCNYPCHTCRNTIYVIVKNRIFCNDSSIF